VYCFPTEDPGRNRVAAPPSGDFHSAEVAAEEEPARRQAGITCGAQNGCPWAWGLTIAGFGPSAMTDISRGAGGSLSGLGDCGRVRPRVRLIAENLCLRNSC